MERDDLRMYCLSKKSAVEEFPFGEDPAVFKVMGKIFALLPLQEPLTISLKCDPDFALILRETYPAVTGAWHLNKRHWNGVAIDGSIPDEDIYTWIDHAYDQIVKSLTKAQRQMLNKMEE